MKTIEDVKNIVSVLTDEQKQVLKDCINYGAWGDGEEKFLNEFGEVEEDGMMGYCTNDAKDAGHFNGRKISALFRAIYNRLCEKDHEIGKVVSHCSDWWGDGSGDMLFIRYEYADAFEKWAKE